MVINKTINNIKMEETGKPGASKLTIERVSVIKQLFNFRDITDDDIARCFKVTREHINHIRHNHRWVDVEVEKPKTGNDYRQFTKTNHDVIKNDIKKQLINKLLDL